MKTLGIVLVVAVALYAIYELFSNNAALQTLFGAAGQTTGSGTATTGQPVYVNVAQPANNQQLIVGSVTGIAASVIPTAVSDAFGPSGNQLSMDESDDSDLSGLVDGSQYDTSGYEDIG
jgi:hypothetical protein